MTPRQRRPAGAQLLTPNRTAFRLWAPDCRAVWLALKDREPQAMLAMQDGWFELQAAVGAGTRYRFRLEDGSEVPDPASRLQAFDCADDPQAIGHSVVVDPGGHDWQHRDWVGRPWHEAVIYELHVGLCGGYKGVTAMLPELAELGITAVELMPIAHFPGNRNWGYDGVLPYAPAAAYGSPDELKNLIDCAHGLGLMVLLDVVYNHFGPDGNFLHRYAQSFFRDDRQTGWGAAIDFRRRPVRDFFIDNALYWLGEYRFDGLRLDAVHAIGDPGFLQELARTVRRQFEPARQVHLILENENNSARLLDAGEPGTTQDPGHFDAQWNDDGHHALHVLLTGEREGYYKDFADDPVARLARCLAEGFIYQGEPSRQCGRLRGEPSAALPPTAFVLFLQNHDHIGNRAYGERLLSLCDPDAYRAAVALLLLSPQIPLIFMGEEYGALEPFLFFTDHRPELAQQVRDGRRQEFAKFAPFAEGSSELPDPNEPTTFEASKPRRNAQSASWRALYRQLLVLRREHLLPQPGTVTERSAKVLGPAAVLSRWRSGNTRFQLYANLDRASVALPARIADHDRLRLLHACPAAAASAFDSGSLAGYSTLLFSDSTSHSEAEA